ncbi:hypothetical protein [cf. Phormidesmis sp. LEGE 11477]|uniref:hypothetical protein n=1 Tax=cf. Phormidesmis sp. LEGE 11477 TaxID=1828680 RepID=UPI00187E7D34|nr:hypothetical protein [cf. Phormidesmis sp. LEGE 11477]MBE9061700.1 hypothetical protein [cf. Phormidesmis sp. LEGE 11477]
MTYTTDRPDPNIQVAPAPAGPVVEYHDTVRWGPIIAGIVVAIVSQLMLSALGAAVGGYAAGEAAPRAIGTGIGIWAVISLLISLFLGAWAMAASCGPMNKKTAMLNATIMWATTLVVSGWLLASGVSGAFGVIASSAGGALTQVAEPGGVSLPNPDQLTQAAPTPQEAAQYAASAATASVSFIIGSLLGLVAALIGSTVGAKRPRTIVR